MPSSRFALQALSAAGLLGTAAAEPHLSSRGPWPYAPPSGTAPSWPGPSSCPGDRYAVTPSFQYGGFSYPAAPTPTTSVTPNTTPVPSVTYAVSYAQVSSLFANLSSTTWPNWTPAANFSTQSAGSDDSYGAHAFSALWQAANPTNFSRGLYSTTASPTTVPTSSLASPPNALYSPETCYKFPKDFIFGAAGSASQCEGAVADAGKTPSFQDMLATIFSLVGTGSASSVLSTPGQTTIETNYVSIEHYYLYKRDIDRLAAMGLKHYSFSLPWTRILPFALPGTPVNEDALQHYDDVINYVLAKGMQPLVTITHFDTPLQFFDGSNYLLSLAGALQNQTYGITGISFGYSNTTIVDAYVNYAKIVMSRYADRVPIWITFNEPQIGSSNGAAVNNVLKAHAQAYHFYKDVLNGTGRVSMKMGITPAVPQIASNQSHVEAANYFNDLYVGAWMKPLALGQDYPEAFKLSVADYVPLTQSDIEYFNNTIDFVSVDAYSAPVVYPAVSNLTACAVNSSAHVFPFCVNATTLTPTGWSIGYSPYGSPTNYISPNNLRTQLNYVYDTYRKPVFVSEFGLNLPAPPAGRLQDNLFNQPGSVYLLSYLNEMLKAIWEDGVDVVGALVWNFADDWEFGTYSDAWGMQQVNRTTQERHYRRAFFDVMGFVEGEGRREK